MDSRACLLVSVKVTFVGKVEIRFMIQTMCVITLMVLLGKPLRTMYSVGVGHWAFQKHATSEAQKSPSQLRFLLPFIIITITSNEP